MTKKRSKTPGGYKAPDQRKTNLITVRFTDDELQAINEAAENNDVGRTGMLHAIIVDAIKDVCSRCGGSGYEP